MSTRFGLFALLLTLLPNLAAAQEPPDPALAAKAYEVLKTHCNRCHGVKFEVEGFNVLRRDSLLNPDTSYIALADGAGVLDDSFLWQRVGVEQDMPPAGGPQPTDEEREILKAWILAGAPFPAEEARPFITEKEMLQAIRDDLISAAKPDRRFFRYFTITNLFNNSSSERIGRNGKPFDSADVPLARAALAKLVNSLSWEKNIVVPKPVDANATVLRVDLRQLGWVDGNLWAEILSGAKEKDDAEKENPYPYGLSYRVHSDADVRTLAREITAMTGNELPWIRADWFIDTASRPPLYHTMLRLPTNVGELEQLLGVNVIEDFKNDKLARAGFAESGVSRHNRLVDRHNASFGMYWKSYDFAQSEDRASLFRFPLGPKFEGNEFDDHAFQHDGGEMIFNLPNGMQGYFLTDAKGNRINFGPIKVVRDLKETGGTAEVVNGLSCMHCHDRGVKRFKDTILTGLAISGSEARLKVQKLFPTAEAMDALLAEDEARFLKAVDAATGTFLKIGEFAERDIGTFKEPIGEVARLYQKDLELEEAAVELGMQNAVELQAAIRGNPRLRELGLAPLIDGAAIKRSSWSSTLNFLSPFHRTALELDRGTPRREL